ncbi:protein takeout-like [Lucilia sericata]|uniref:protein takeout-like n=1 Tax=Lucilia sericata TaxID=13632 RepID=UPI0018A7F225|nr:protein takeout-like [Lucilia sericata]
MFLKIVAILIFSVCSSTKAGFPDDPKPCKYADSECIKGVIDSMFKNKLDGDDSINLQSLNPLNANTVHIHQGEESPVNLDLELKNNHIYGLETLKAIKVKGFGKDLTGKHGIKLHSDYMSLVGDYDIDGKILILPIKGTGKSNITMVDVEIIINFVGTPLEKDGATYMHIEEVNSDAEPKRMIYKVENLFNGDKALGDNMNLFLNENWKEIYAEVRVSICKAFSEIFKDVINEVFSKYPYDKYFIESDDPKPCKYEDSECIIEIINSLFKDKLDGDDSINLQSLNPLKANTVNIHQGKESPVSLDLVLKNNLMGFGKDLTGKHSIMLHSDYMSVVGDYDIDGKILILPIKGTVDVEIFMNFVGTPMEKDGATYMHIEEMNSDAEPKGMIYKVENLFNGDKALGDNMNLFLNENWQEIYAEVRLSICKAFGDIFKDVINEVFSKYPYDKYFIE